MVRKPSAAEADAEVSELAVPVAAAAPVERAALVPAFLVVVPGQEYAGYAHSLHWPPPDSRLVGGPHRWKSLASCQADLLFLSSWARSSCSVGIPYPIVTAGSWGYLTSPILCHFLTSLK